MSDEISQPGYVYFITSGRVGPVKIGKAVDVRDRLHSIQNCNWKEMYLLYHIRCDMRAEKLLHDFFAPHRIRREWYRRVDAFDELFHDFEDFQWDLEIIPEPAFCLSYEMVEYILSRFSQKWCPDFYIKFKPAVREHNARALALPTA